MERGGAAATASAAGAKVFGGSRLKTLFGISKGIYRPLRVSIGLSIELENNCFRVPFGL